MTSLLCFLPGTNSAHTILKGVQLNNKALAVAVQAEKEKVRQANVVILQLKREQQALFLHLLLLKRKLKEQEALAAGASEVILGDLWSVLVRDFVRQSNSDNSINILFDRHMDVRELKAKL